MVLPKVIYENLPFAYFIISGYILTFDLTWITLLSAGLFYSAGCIVLVTRSAYRRKDRNMPLKHRIPEFIYEYMPFAYGAVAIFMFMTTSQPIFQFIAFTLVVIALRNLICRHNNRKKSDSLYK